MNSRYGIFARAALRTAGLVAATVWVAARPVGAEEPAGAAARPPKARAVIQIWLWGGPPHLDTFDPKPAAGYDYCGQLSNPIPTNVDGVMIGELLPLLAQ